MRRYSSWLLMVLVVVACGGSVADDVQAEATPDSDEMVVVASGQELSCVVMGDTDGRASPLTEVRFTYEGGEGLLCYGAPSANGREVMGGLVPFGQPWRAGANEPTTLHLSAAASMGGIALDAGSYSIYAIPGESEWELCLNTSYERWGIPINAEVRSSEVGCFSVAAGSADDMVETLTWEHMEGHFMLSWENTHLHIPFGS